MHSFRQIWAVALMNLQSVPQRWGASLVTVIGVASAVAVMISLLAVGAGLMRSVDRNDHPDLAIVLSSQAPAEFMGSFSRAQIAMIASAPGVKMGTDGKPMVQPYGMVLVEVVKKEGGGTGNLVFRGSGTKGLVMQSGIHLTQGRVYRPGLHELVVGKGASTVFKNLAVGNTIMLRGIPWKVVGMYEDNGGIDENSISSDADTVLSAFGRTAYQSVLIQLNSPADFERFRDSLKRNPQFAVDVKHLTQYYKDQLSGLTTLFDFVGYFVGTVMAIGAVFGALTTMYSAVDTRVREIATLRAIGFGATAVVVSVLLEALLLAIPGALLGAAVATLLFNNNAMTTGGISFQLAVTPGLVLFGIAWALAIGLVGGLAPSIRAARLPVATALRAT